MTKEQIENTLYHQRGQIQALHDFLIAIAVNHPSPLKILEEFSSLSEETRSKLSNAIEREGHYTVSFSVEKQLRSMGYVDVLAALSDERPQ